MSDPCRKSAEWLIQTPMSHHCLRARCVHPQSDGSVQLRDDGGNIVAVVTAGGVVVVQVQEKPEC